ncbi:hypothetical protein [Nocardioides sp.]
MWSYQSRNSTLSAWSDGSVLSVGSGAVALGVTLAVTRGERRR